MSGMLRDASSPVTVSSVSIAADSEMQAIVKNIRKTCK